LGCRLADRGAVAQATQKARKGPKKGDNKLAKQQEKEAKDKQKEEKKKRKQADATSTLSSNIQNM
jgi:hypothetical protein